MSTPRKAYGWEKVLRCLLEGGGFYLSADTITNRCGVKQPARRIHDLAGKGLTIQSKYLNREKGIYGYKLHPDSVEKAHLLLGDHVAPAPQPEPEEIGETLFDAPPRQPDTSAFGEAA